jgi:hypothetical protein
MLLALEKLGLDPLIILIVFLLVIAVPVWFGFKVSKRRLRQDPMNLQVFAGFVGLVAALASIAAMVIMFITGLLTTPTSMYSGSLGDNLIRLAAVVSFWASLFTLAVSFVAGLFSSGRLRIGLVALGPLMLFLLFSGVFSRFGS